MEVCLNYKCINLQIAIFKFIIVITLLNKFDFVSSM